MGNHSQPSGEHVTISYAGFNRPWASWIAHQLRARGLEATMMRWDPRVDVPFESEFEKLLAAEGRILLVLDNWYFKLGPIPEEDWQRVLADLVPPHADRFAAVSVATQEVPGSVDLLGPVDLHDLDEHEAVRRLLRRLSLDPAQPAVALPTDTPRFPNEPPAVLDIPRRNRRFTGRDAELERIHALLTAAGTRDPAATRLVLYGGTGTGKTQIAAEYAHRFGNDYDVVWWIDATHRANARERLAALAPRLGLPVGERIGERIRAVQEAVRSDERSRRWLLVFDGADDALQLADLLPEDGHGQVLLTSTTRDWSAVPGIREIGIRSFSRVESVAFVRRRAPRVTPGEADALASAVQDLPLLLAQTAAWLDANDLPVGEYLRQLHDTPQSAQIQTEATYPKGFQTAWSITLATLRERHPKAAMLLNLLAFFSPNEIPVRLLTEVHYKDLHDDLDELVRDPRAWHLALRRLSEYTAVRLDYEQDLAENPAVEQVRMHRLYHRFLREELQSQDGKLYADMACQVLISADPRRPADTRDWGRYARLIPHLEFAGAFDSNRPAVQELVLNCIEYLRVRGEYRSGLKLCDEVLAHWQRSLDPSHGALLSLYHKRGNILRQDGRYHEAEQLGRTVVRRLTADKPADHPDLLRAKDGLGSTLLALGQFTQARDLFTEAAARFAEQFGTEAPQTLAARHNLGLALMLLGRYSEAREIHREVLQIRQRRLRSRHYLTLHSGAVYARLIRLMGDYPEAASRLEQIVRTLRQISDERHPQSISADHQLGMCRRRAGDYDEARERLSSAAFRAAQVLGPQHPETLVAEADYATFLREHGELSAAMKYAESVTERYARLLGRDHPYSIGTRANVGLALGHAGDRDAALRHAESAHREMTAAVGRDHPWTLGCALNLSAARSHAYDVEGARELSHDTLMRAGRALGAGHPLTLSAKMALADDLRALGRVQQAAGFEEDAVRKLGDTLGPEHPHTRDAQRRVRPYWDFEPQPL
jgi:tetratricopeptide (TPR) repeat protein